jgi:biotin carboxyl carrier protein
MLGLHPCPGDKDMSDQDPKPPVTPMVNEPNEQGVPTRRDERAIAAAQRTAATEEPGYGVDTITSPFVGTCYLQPRPGEPPFVKVGDLVEPGRTLCFIESGILFNEVKATFACQIKEVVVTDQQTVGYGTALFRVYSL